MVPGTGKTVALFAICINDTIFPGTPITVVKVLERLGYKVVFPREQTCCDRMLTNAGYFKEAAPTVRSYVRAFENYDYVVGPSGPYVGAVRHQHPMLTEHVGDKSLKAASEEPVKRTYDFTEFLADVLGLTNVGVYFPRRVTYHPTCHSVRVAHVGNRSYKLLKAVWSIDLVPLPDSDRCCDFGGTFCIKNSDVSAAMGADRTCNMMSTGAGYLVTGDNTCLMHIGGIMHRMNMGVKTIHLAEILTHTGEAAARPPHANA